MSDAVMDRMEDAANRVFDVLEKVPGLTTGDSIGAITAVLASLICEASDNAPDHAQALFHFEDMVTRTLRRNIEKAVSHGPMRLVKP